MKTQNEAIIALIAMRAAHLDAEMYDNLARRDYGQEVDRTAYLDSATRRKADALTHFKNLKAYLESLG
ncbi:MAG: hypothetical protein ACK5X3_20460 [Pseudomonadota bacterium]